MLSSICCSRRFVFAFVKLRSHLAPEHLSDAAARQVVRNDQIMRNNIYRLGLLHTDEYRVAEYGLDRPLHLH